MLLIVVFFFVVGRCTDFNVRDYGAKGDGKTLDFKAIEATFGACAAAKGGRVIFPKGEYLTSPFNLTSNTEVVLEKDAVILGVQEKSLYPVIAPLPSYGRSRDVGYTRYQPLVFGANLTNVKISGEGKIDGQGKYWWELHKSKKLKIGRPRLVELMWSKNIEISGVTLENSGFWTLHPIYCSDIYIHDINIFASPSSPNTDGIDPDSSQNVLIERVFINCGDDHIAIKSGMDEAGMAYNWPTKNVTIRHCTFGLGDGISIGSETSGGISDIYIHDCKVIGGSKGTYIKSGRGRGNIVQNVKYENLVFEFVGVGIDIDMNWGHLPPANFSRTTPTIRNVKYQNIRGTAGQHGKFWCLEESACHGIEFDDVKITAVEKYSCQNAFGKQKDCEPKICVSPE